MMLSQVRNFIIRERMYIWLLIFVISVTIAMFLTGKRKAAPSMGPKNFSSKILNESLTKEKVVNLIQHNRKLGYITAFFSFAISTTIIAGLFLDFVIFTIKKEGGILLFPTMPHREPSWGIWDVCKVIILFVWFSYMLMFIESALSKVVPMFKTDDNLCAVLNATITDLLVFMFIIYFVVSEYKDKVISLGFSFKGAIKNFFYGVFGYIATIPILTLVLLLIIWLSAFFKYTPPMQPVLEIFLEEKKRVIVTYLTIFVAIFGPIVEETFFRGFMYKAVKKRFGFKTAIFSTSIFFALLHTNLAGFLPIMILGMLLAYLFEKTGTLVASCTVHIIHNSVMTAFVFLTKGLLQ